MAKPLAVIDHNIEISQQYISYIFKINNEEVNYYDEKYILNSHLQNLFKCMKKAYQNEQELTIDIVFDYCQKEGVRFEKDDIKLIVDSFNDFNIKYLRKQLNQEYIKQVLNKQAIEDLLTHLTSNKDIDLTKLEKFTDDVNRNLSIIKNDGDISFDKNIERFEDYYRRSMAGEVKQRSMGDPLIDKFTAYPGEPGDMIGLALRTGTGKTTIALNWANYLCNSGIPVIYFSLDMGERSVINRMLCMREGLTLDEINMKEKPARIERKVERALKRYKENKHFILYTEPSASIDDLDKYIYRAKEQFKENGVLDKDEYCVIVIDTIDIVDEFGGADAYGSQHGINKMHYMVRKHKCFCINLYQINENTLRSGKKVTPEDIDEGKMQPKKSDIWGSSAYSKRSRFMITGERPKHLKLELFPEHDDVDMWKEMEEDILILTCVKQNDKPLFKLKYHFDGEFYRILPLKE